MSEHNLEQRLADLEARFAFLDDQLQQLDEIVVAQRQLLESLHSELDRTQKTIETMHSEAPNGGAEPPPPHY